MARASTVKGPNMADAQVALKLPVLRLGSDPETGPTVIQYLQLMLNERGGFRNTDHEMVIFDSR